MAVRTAIVLLFLYCISWSHNVAEGRRRLSEEEDTELEKQIQLLNKPAVETIRTKNGDVYNCVDFYKQPAFDHPSLKNHKFHFQMRPSSYPKRKRNKTETNDSLKPSNLWENGKGCPFGTVPIRRVTKDDLIRIKLATEVYSSNLSPSTAENPGVHYAVVHSQPDTDFKYHGGGMVATLHNVKVEGSQYSSAHVKFQNGPDSIEYGWMINPILNKDNHTRLFVFTNAGTSHCFNSYCPGVVSVSQDIPLDAVIPQVSTRGGTVHALSFFIYQDELNGNWFLEIGAKDYDVIGFWPKNIFTAGLADLATYVEYGGQVYSPPSDFSPPMGSGYTLSGNKDQDAFFCNITIINEQHQIVDVHDTQEYVDVDVYGVKDEGYVDDYYRHLFFYGGYGGFKGN